MNNAQSVSSSAVSEAQPLSQNAAKFAQKHARPSRGDRRETRPCVPGLSVNVLFRAAYTVYKAYKATRRLRDIEGVEFIDGTHGDPQTIYVYFIGGTFDTWERRSLDDDKTWSWMMVAEGTLVV